MQDQIFQKEATLNIDQEKIKDSIYLNQQCTKNNLHLGTVPKDNLPDNRKNI